MKLDVNGTETYCYTNNRTIDPGRESVVFIHGSGLDHTVWTLAARHFARHGRNVLAVDMPGHGRSSGEPLASVEAMADWIVKLCDAIGVHRAALCGHSLGSLVALDCASREGQSECLPVPCPVRAEASGAIARTSSQPKPKASKAAAPSNGI